MNDLTIKRINKALKKEVGGVFFRAGNGEGILRFLEDDPPQSLMDKAIAVVNRFTVWQPDYSRMKIVEDYEA
jgi:hypothetical protein